VLGWTECLYLCSLPPHRIVLAGATSQMCRKMKSMVKSRSPCYLQQEAAKERGIPATDLDPMLLCPSSAAGAPESPGWHSSSAGPIRLWLPFNWMYIQKE
jgi:hypothetical protein